MTTPTSTIAPFVIPANIIASLPDYSDVSDTLPSMQSELLNADANLKLDADAAMTIAMKMCDEAKGLLDWTLLGACGWTLSTLDAKAKSRFVDWTEVMIDAITSDDQCPLKETGKVILHWSEAAPASRAAVDAFYVALMGKPLTTLFNEINAEISNAH
tara:strand:- start:3833 stop:4306 length:474 start_codon:yes stop_codon:yes gene_type:complete